MEMSKQRRRRRYRNKRARKVDDAVIGETSIVGRPAQEGATAGILKGAEKLSFLKFKDDGADQEFQKLRLTTAVNDHQHTVDPRKLEETGYRTSMDRAPGAEIPHSHAVVRNDDGSFEIGLADGHTHDIVFKQAREFTTQQRERLADTGAARPDGSFPIRDRRDLQNAIQAFGRANEEDRPAVARHIRSRARALGLTDLLPEEGRLADLLKGQSSMSENKDKNKDGPSASDFAEMKKQLDELKGQLSTATAVNALSDDHRTFYKSLDEKDATAFLKSSSDDRDAAIAKAAGKDPVVVTIDGVEFRKSAGEAVIAMAKQAARDREEMRKMRDELELREFAKQADESLGALPGTSEAKAEVLRYIANAPTEAMRKAAAEMLAAGNTAAVSATVEKGFHADVPEQGADAKREALRKHLRQVHNLPAERN